MRQLTSLVAFSMLVVSSGAYARGSKNVNIVNQGGATWYQKTIANYTSDQKSAAQAGGGSDYDKAQRELEAINLEMTPLQQKVDADSAKLTAAEAALTQGQNGVGISGADIHFTDSATHDQDYLDNKAKVQQLQIRANKLQQVADQQVNELSTKIKVSDKKLIDSLATMPADSKDAVVTGDQMRDFASTTLARLQLSDLKSNWTNVSNKASNDAAALQVVKAKLDQSIIGTYINKGVLQSSNFCSAVKQATSAASCANYGIDDPAAKAAAFNALTAPEGAAVKKHPVK